MREIFRTLVTSQGTRAVAEREEVLSLFPERKAAEEVLGELIDARLLTSYEVAGAENDGGFLGRRPGTALGMTHRVEIAHESLLRAWPRLVRWQTQDEDGALLRDQLRQAAHLWEEKGRTSDLLWTGTAFQEYELWRGRYAGALTALEEDFAKAMAEKARRRKRRLTAAVASVIVALAGVAIAIGVSRQQAARARDRAQAEALRAESAKLLALAQLRLADDPTEALAFATASLELVDTRPAREFVDEGPVGGPSRPRARHPELWTRLQPRRAPPRPGRPLRGRWRSGGTTGRSKPGWEATRCGCGPTSPTGFRTTCSSPSSTADDPGRLVRVWSIPDGRLVRTVDLGAPGYCQVHGEQLVCRVPKDPADRWRGEARLLSWQLPDGEPTDLGRFDRTAEGAADLTLTGRGFAYARGRQLFWRPPPGSRTTGDRLFGRHDADIVGLNHWHSDRLYSFDEAGRYRLWAPTGDGFALEGEFQRPADAPATALPGPTSRWLLAPGDGARARLWDLASLPGARPLVLRRAGSSLLPSAALHPAGDWLVVAGMDERVDFWPVRNPRPAIVDGCRATGGALSFSADGRWLVTICGPAEFKALHLWPLPGTGPRSLGKVEALPLLNLAPDPGGRYVFGVGFDRSAVIPMDGSPARILPSSQGSIHTGAAVSPSGRRVATAYSSGSGEKKLYVWDVESGAAKAFDIPPLPPPDLARGVTSAAFADESTLYTSGGGGLRRWNVEDGTSTLVAATPGRAMSMALVPGGRQAVTRLEPYESALGSCSGIELRDLGTGEARAAAGLRRLRLLGLRRRCGRPGRGGRRPRRQYPSRPTVRGGAAPPSRPQGRGPVRRPLAGPPLGGLRGRGQYAAPLADAGPVEAAAAHAAARGADRQAALPHEPADGARRCVAHRLEGRRRALPRLEGRADLVAPPTRPVGGPGRGPRNDPCGLRKERWAPSPRQGLWARETLVDEEDDHDLGRPPGGARGGGRVRGVLCLPAGRRP